MTFRFSHLASIGMVLMTLNLHSQSLLCPAAPCTYLNTTMPAESRAADLVRRMTLDEKVAQTMDHAPAIPRLGIAEYNWWNEGLHGVARSGIATVFPQAIALAATWDSTLVHDVASAISTEARARYNESVRRNKFGRYTGLTYWSPNINIFRDPRWGRGQETYGEDPFLTATTGVAFIRGLQGDDPRYFKVIATAKHFAVHSGPEPGRHGFDVHPSPFDLEDTYLPAFRAAITEASAYSIMCAYNALNGVPACASKALLQDYLHTAWKFKGFVVSDCDAIDDVRRGHKYSPDNAHASAVSVLAGTDLDCGSAYKDLGVAVQQGLLKEADLDAALVRLFTARMRLGMFDPAGSVPYSKLTQRDIDSPEHRALALRAARESMVLLRNRAGILPLSKQTRVAVIGPTADLLQAVEGNYNGAASSPTLPLQGITTQFGKQNVIYSAGSMLAEGIPAPIPAAYLKPAPNATTQGLKGEYFDNPTFTGTPKVERIDRVLNFDWESVAPAPQLPATRLSVRWTGLLDFPAAGRYMLFFRGIPQPRKTVDVTGEGTKAYTGTAPLLRMFVDGKLFADSSTGQPSATFEAKAHEQHDIRIEYVRTGNDRAVSLQWITPARALLDDALAAARSADVIVAFVGLSPDLEGEQMSVQVPGFNGGDRTSIDLPAPQDELLKELKKTGKPLIVVLTSGSGVALNWANDNADAILEAWYAGEEAGTAIAETLAGANNPSGRLPITFYRDTHDLPAFEDYSMSNRTYRYFRGPVLFPFGFGLSYAGFTITDPVLSKASIRAGEPITLTTKVKNTSGVAGDDVVQVYIQAPAGKNAAHPFLSGFERVHLQPGEVRAVAITINPRQLSRVDTQGQRSIDAGRYKLYVADHLPSGDSKDPAVSLQIEGTQVLPK